MWIVVCIFLAMQFNLHLMTLNELTIKEEDTNPNRVKTMGTMRTIAKTKTIVKVERASRLT